MSESDLPEEERLTGRQVFAGVLASELAHSTPNSDEAWQDAADSILEALDEKRLLLVHEAFLLALKNGVRNA